MTPFSEIPDFNAITPEEKIQFIAQTIEGEWNLNNIGKFAVADCMASRMTMWQHDLRDIAREFHGWKLGCKPDEFSLWLANLVVTKQLRGSGFLYCFSKYDVEVILPKLGYKPGTADLYIDDSKTKLGLRLYRTKETWAGT